MLSANKTKILGLFFTNTGQSFYTGEIARAIGKKPGVIQRSLEKMVSEGILKSEYRGNARYFTLNSGYRFYDELKSIVFKTAGAAGAVREIFGKIPGIDYAFIYGSYASGREHAASDIDIFILGRADEDEIVTAAGNLEKRLKREINYKLMPVDSFCGYIRRKDPFIASVYNDKKVMIKGDEDGLRKVVEGKPDKKAKT